MNRKQFVFLLLALAIIGGGGLVLSNRNRKSWTAHEAKAGDKVLPNFRYNDVATIHIKGFNEFNVVRTNGIWRIPERGNYQANFHAISDLLLKLKEVKVVQSEIIGASQLDRVELDESHRILVEFKDAQGRVMDTLIVGKRHDRPQNENEPLGIHGFWDGRYVLLPGEPSNVLLISDYLGSIIPEPGSWLNPEFFKVVNVKFMSAISPVPSNSWSILRETEKSPWVLADAKPGEVLEQVRASVTAEMMEFPRFSDLITNTPPFSTNWGLDKPTIISVVADKLAYTLKVGTKQADGNYFMTVAVAADLPEQRVAGKDETALDKIRLDEEFQNQTKELREKVAKARALAPWIFKVDPWIETVMRNRVQLLQTNSVDGAAAGSN